MRMTSSGARPCRSPVAPIVRAESKPPDTEDTMAVQEAPDMVDTSAASATEVPAGIDPEVPPDRERAWREWMMVGTGLVALLAVLALVLPWSPRRVRQGRRLREVPVGRPDAAGRSCGGGQALRRRRVPARDEGRRRSRPDRGVELCRQRQAAPRDRRERADGRHARRHRRLHPDERLEQADGRDHAALARLPFRRGQPGRPLRGPRARPAPALPLRGRAPGRLHVPLRDAAGPAPHRRGHGSG
jgi:hypothetical protein